jgi:Heparinase II/III-like protein
VLVHDELSSASAHEYTQTWHLAPNATPAGSAQSLTATAGGRAQLTITQANPAGVTLQSLRGATDPQQGWYSSSYGSKVPSWALQYTREGTTAAFGTLLATGPYAAESAVVAETPGAEADVLKVCVGGTTGYVVTVPHANAAAPTIAAGGCET